MAALTITAANVLRVSGPVETDQPAGEAFIAGACVYKADDGTWKKAQCDGTSLEAGANQLGLALATADAVGARVSIAVDDSIVGIGTGTAGVVYLPGRTAGSLIPAADLLSTDKVTPFAVGIGTSRIQIRRNYNAGAVL